MNKVSDSIGWADFTVNPVRGLCPLACKDMAGKEYCYARRMYKRFYWPPEIWFAASTLWQIERLKKPSRIFVGSTMELFGPWVRWEWLNAIFVTAQKHPQHTFIFLTKMPLELQNWSPFPDNAWVGFSATNQAQYNEGIVGMAGVKAAVKFVSFEPLLQPIHPVGAYDLSELNWVILGSQTQPVRHPHREWVTEIIRSANSADIPVFLKEPLASYLGIERKENPW